ncbi:alpha/beta hydrolase [Aquincola sp. S2]|uniref:Alpha/beta hydrolase n=1 Tax=Pseudaquabacterium terrae TaxID=2732868 RepID=A0ABX2EG34_9BURK|nr:alpha/beta hydrolase [Aquabacterium terrae]NRF67546.1 alpha/beta hydrolase [Aquabacterium terrae]
MLDPQARGLLDLIATRGVPPTHLLSPDEARRIYRERRFFTQPDPPALAEVRDLSAATPTGPVPLRLYRPAGLPARAPVLVYFHGGGWTIGDLDTHDVLCRELAVGGRCAVVAVDYRRAPEHRFPAAVDDAIAATRWLQAGADTLGLDAGRLALGGDSAGGNLAAVVAIALRGGATPAPRLQLLVYPATDQRAIAPSHTSNGTGYLLTRETVAYFRGHYLDERDWPDWRASPLLQLDLSRLPPALVLTAGFDPLRDEGRQYADALSAAGTPTQYICFERQIHGFLTMGRVIDEARTAVDLCAAALRRHLG